MKRNQLFILAIPAALLPAGDSWLQARITEPHGPPLMGMEIDLAPGIESYVKDWKTMDIGNITLRTGEATLCLKALDMPGKTVIDFRLLVFESLN